MIFYAEAEYVYMVADLKFTVDTSRKFVVVNAGISAFDIKLDLYKGLKTWAQLEGNMGYESPIRGIGGDSLPDSQFAGDQYFMINGYRVVYDPAQIQITGILNSDDFATPWLYNQNIKLSIFPATVSNLALSQATATNVITGDLSTIPTAAQNATAVRTELTAELANVVTSNKLLRNRTETNPVTGIMTVYDDDGTTVLFTANIWENVAGTTPYAGNAVNRRERMA